MSASNVLALTTLFLATMFAETEWKEFTSSEGNFRVVFPETPQQQKGTERNLHRFSAAAGAESYGLTYADYPPSADWESVVNGERDSIVNGFSGAVVDERPTSVEGYPGKWVRFVGQNTSGELAIYFVVHRLYVLHAFAPKSTPRPQNFSTFLNSFVIKTEGVVKGMGEAGPRRSVGDCRLEGTVITAIFVDLESNLEREFVSQARELVVE